MKSFPLGTNNAIINVVDVDHPSDLIPENKPLHTVTFVGKSGKEMKAVVAFYFTGKSPYIVRESTRYRKVLEVLRAEGLVPKTAKEAKITVEEEGFTGKYYFDL